MTPIWVIGSGGHAKVVIDTLNASGAYRVAGLLDDDPGRLGKRVLDARVEGDATAESIARLGARHAIIAVGSNRARAAIAERLGGHLVWATVVHPRAFVAASATLGQGTQVFAGAVIQPDAVIDQHVIVNTSSSIDHDCRVRSFVHLAPGVHLAGDVMIGEGALIGIGAGVLPGRSVGSWATVGAGAIVVKDIPANASARGVPARPY